MNNPISPKSRFNSVRRVLTASVISTIVMLGGLVLVPEVAGAASAAPSAPLSVSASYAQGGRMVSVTWKAPTANTPASTYEVVSSPGSFTCTTTGLRCNVGGLLPGTTYTFYVTASNSYGVGPRSVASNRVTITQRPGVVAGLVTSYATGTTSLTATWGAPSTGYPVPSSYTVALGTGGPSVSTAAHTYTFANLVPGQSYTITVTPVNTVGAGTPLTTAPVTIAQYPGAPSGVTANLVAGGGVLVSWVAPTSGYPRPNLYTVTSSPGGLKCTSSGTSCVVSLLSLNTSYTFSVTATNPLGTGAAGVSNVVTIRHPLAAPGAPTFVAPKANVRQVTLHWKASSNCGSGCVYSVMVNGVKFAATRASTLVVTRLVPDTAYTFRVSASSSRGVSLASGRSKVVRVWLTIIGTGTTLTAGHTLYSPNRVYRLVILKGGRLACMRGGATHWITVNSGGTTLTINPSGNVEFTGVGGAVVWASGTSFAGVSRIGLSNSGNLEISNGGRVIWESNGGQAGGLEPGPAGGTTTPTATIP